MISLAARKHPWPSIQKASEMLAARCALGLRLRAAQTIREQVLRRERRAA